MVKLNQTIKAEVSKGLESISKKTAKVADNVGNKVKNLSRNEVLADTASTQSAKITSLNNEGKNAQKSINAAAANSAYGNVANKQEMISEVIHDKYGQTIIVTSDYDNLDDVIVTFMNTGKTFKCPVKELPSYDIHIGQ